MGERRLAWGHQDAHDFVGTHKILAGLQPMGRMGEMQEIVEAVLYLENAGFVTGETWTLMGGACIGRW